ncbi:hypothetical protein [Leptolyngbya sp. FACHB-17]|uniref:hypothetical protein n=1 Tax=unclassified Leptolyngbya TaxID=2650499 RepID=UPI0016817302|nr:hypothetical protein [Leptolyngbya sp. FACHB-17]MBD2080841.1 hypothetical protein [Leptolyngbya sp. FACHB-17]
MGESDRRSSNSAITIFEQFGDRALNAIGLKQQLDRLTGAIDLIEKFSGCVHSRPEMEFRANRRKSISNGLRVREVSA